MIDRGPERAEWSWSKTRQRLSLLGRLAWVYRTRSILSLLSMLAATVTALAPPFLAKYALDSVATSDPHLDRLWWIIPAFLGAGLANWAMSYVQTYTTGWVGE